MGVPTSEVGYTSATARRGDHESSNEHVGALEGGEKITIRAGLEYEMLVGRMPVIQRVGTHYYCTRCGVYVDDIV